MVEYTPLERGRSEGHPGAPGGGIADPPKDPAKLLNPDPLVFAYAPVQDPAVYGPVFADLLRDIEKVTGKKVPYFDP
jgi:phosphonate transport system substrate-binding protein